MAEPEACSPSPLSFPVEDFIHKTDKMLLKISVFLQACCMYQSILKTYFPTVSYSNHITFCFPCTQKGLLHTRPYALKILPKVVSVPDMHCSLHNCNSQRSLKMPPKWHDRMSLKTIRINMSKAWHQEDHLHISALGRLSVPYSTTGLKGEKYPASS